MSEDTMDGEDLTSESSDKGYHDQTSEKELANSYTKQLFENYDEDILREILGDRYEERRKEYEDLIGTSDEQ